MTREIKFRAWIPRVKRMIIPDIIQPVKLGCIIEEVLDEGNNIHFSDGHKLMQYTGLKDKNGVEIYDGDIIKYDDDESMSHWVSGENAVIINLPGRFVARMKPYDIQEGGNQNVLNEEFQDSATIIGNIYQNPELLSEK